ncbi:MAG: cell wall-binding repeat-containing protein, partial [Actinobacteria bacterium]|nr:cell wall-binding repeat-containing protein [Actinomycetota bacterium]MCG2808326.1 cell wall-binding repeat-containing protein [Coriobacteriia bacterium]
MILRRARTALATGLCLVLCVCSGGSLRAAGVLANSDSEAFAAASEMVATHVSYSTLAGSDRYGTAVTISREAYPDTADTVVLADGTGWPDALGGGVLAGVNAGPVLLLGPTGLGEPTAAEIRRLRPTRVFVLGGPEAVSDEVFSSIVDVAGQGARVMRLAGDDRYSTAALVASQAIDAFSVWGGTALVASGRTYADALSAGSYAIAAERPIFLIDDAHSQQVVSEMRAAGVSRVIVLGGDKAVSPAVRAVLARELGTGNVDRLAGADRYQTAALLADMAVLYQGFSLRDPGLAAGTSFADALTASPLLAQRNSPLILVPQAQVTDALADWLYSRRSEIDSFVAFGGDSALPGPIKQDVLLSLAAPRFDAARAMSHVRTLAGYGPRRAGSAAERRALDYFAAELRSYGY